MPENNTPQRRFKVALSFPGEKREYIKEVAELLVAVTGEETIFYDHYFEDELAIPDSDILLMDMYKDHSELVAVFLCKEYSEKEWCGLEWGAIRDMKRQKRKQEIMFFRFDDTPIDGMLGIYGYVDIKGRQASVITELILKRLEKNGSITNRPRTVDAVPTIPLPTNASVNTLEEINQKIDQLLIQQQTSAAPALQQQIDALSEEKEILRKQLLQSETIIEQQENTRKELETLLNAEKDKVALKQEALKAVEERNYDKAETLVKEAAAERIQEVADDFFQLGKINELKLDYREALRYYELAGNIQTNNSTYLYKAGRISNILGWYDKALFYREKELIVNLEKFSHNHAEIGANYNNIGVVYHNKEENDKALENYLKSLHIYEETLDKNDARIATTLDNIGIIYAKEGDTNRALEYHIRALDIFKIALGEQHIETAIAYNNIGTAYQDKGEYEKALEYLTNSLVVKENLYGKEHPNTAVSFNNIALVWHYWGNNTKAIEYGEKAYDIYMNVFGPDHPTTKIVKDNLDTYENAQ